LHKILTFYQYQIIQFRKSVNNLIVAIGLGIGWGIGLELGRKNWYYKSIWETAGFLTPLFAV